MFSAISLFWIKGSVELFLETSVRVFSRLTGSFCVMRFFFGSGVATGGLTSPVFVVCPDSFCGALTGFCNCSDTVSELVSVEAGPHPVAMTVDTNSKVITVHM